jgi:ABC-2 type transport system ATP-binding protein
MSILQFDRISRSHSHGRLAIDSVNLAIEAGDVVGLLGRNGAGKTTLIHCAMGMIQPQSGSVRVFGMDPFRQGEAVKQRVGFVSEDQIFPGYLRTGEIIGLHRGLFPDWDRSLEADLLRRFSLPTRAKVRSLSRGQARQLALLCALAHRPELLVLDEPAGGLDPAMRQEFLEQAIRLIADRGSAVLFSSHHMNDVERIARRVAFLDEGSLILNEEVDVLRATFSLAILPKTEIASRREILDLEACLRVRDRGSVWHAIFRCERDLAGHHIEQGLGITGHKVHAVNLEDIMIELVGVES